MEPPDGANTRARDPFDKDSLPDCCFAWVHGTGHLISVSCGARICVVGVFISCGVVIFSLPCEPEPTEPFLILCLILCLSQAVGRPAGSKRGVSPPLACSVWLNRRVVFTLILFIALPHFLVTVFLCSLQCFCVIHGVHTWWFLLGFAIGSPRSKYLA